MSDTHQTMHGEHRSWESEISLWRDDLQAWQHELAKARGEIKQLEQAMEKHANALREHASSLRLEEQTFDTHELALVQYEKGGEGDELFEMARNHGNEAVGHAQHRATHEQLKRRHHNVIAHWNVLLKALREPAESSTATESKVIVVPS